MNVNGVHVGLAFVFVAVACIGKAWLGSWRELRSQIRDSRIAPQPEPDYDEMYRAGIKRRYPS